MVKNANCQHCYNGLSTLWRQSQWIEALTSVKHAIVIVRNCISKYFPFLTLLHFTSKWYFQRVIERYSLRDIEFFSRAPKTPREIFFHEKIHQKLFLFKIPIFKKKYCSATWKTNIFNKNLACQLRKVQRHQKNVLLEQWFTFRGLIAFKWGKYASLPQGTSKLPKVKNLVFQIYLPMTCNVNFWHFWFPLT